MTNNHRKSYDSVRRILAITKLVLAILWLLLKILELFV
jgi:hypothetical protein